MDNGGKKDTWSVMEDFFKDPGATIWTRWSHSMTMFVDVVWLFRITPYVWDQIHTLPSEHFSVFFQKFEKTPKVLV
jgi:hypothetical protein